MGDDFRRKMLLSHLGRANEILGGPSSEYEEESENDTLGSLSNFQDRSTNSHRSAMSILKIENKKKLNLSGDNNEEDSRLPSWKDFFDNNEIVELKQRNYRFNTYFTIPSIDEDELLKMKSIPFFVFHHGAGSSGLTFASLAKNLYKRLNGNCGSFSFDARGHSMTKPIDDTIKTDYNRASFIGDFVALFSSFFDKHLLDKTKLLSKISIILIGHSFGGSVCTFSFKEFMPMIRKYIEGVAMFDIVEEAAILALKEVDKFLQKTPNVFTSNKDAINWHIQHGLCKSKPSAEISVPALFKKSSSGKIVRITNLKSFVPYWDTWFKDLSKSFVALPTSKLLILAGNDNLDKDLIVGQMRGKYQLVVFQDSGHFIQEDTTAKAALTLIDFWKRNDSKNVVIQTNWGTPPQP
ncbi:hypothetical protein TBLA_0A03160 [Henningerozyma blattae CBS 6284]|uniref:Protein phosphatase methylesterase 1 n=1 Tax=Henningerozyma blattae (strain ATCC 34711 / CBS 6284 / DSM 70876 / NBRC 10599 / NRRL Y-10934 / UCD 77-7) TaxID=1071380 RepID=I2GVG4_HENB6|nr:hypothetical protein TBLA_0A03160 [Tetrapisispora blattae CBS 6284]CCH58116.1 hypothetical protein TBLA_0A03160 [Tetrapisispora blattae CBS 6284]